MKFETIEITTEGLKKAEKDIQPYKIYNKEVICIGSKGLYVHSNNKLKKQLGCNIIRVISKPFEANTEKLYYLSVIQGENGYHLQLNQYTYESKTKKVVIDVFTGITSKEEAEGYIFREDIYFRYLDENNIIFGYRNQRPSEKMKIYYMGNELMTSSIEKNNTYENLILILKDQAQLKLQNINFKIEYVAWIKNQLSTYLLVKQDSLTRWEKKDRYQHLKDLSGKYKDLKDDVILVEFNHQSKEKTVLEATYKLSTLERCDYRKYVNVISIENQEIIYQLLDFVVDKNYIINYNFSTKEKAVIEITRNYDGNLFKLGNRIYSFNGKSIIDIFDENKDTKYPTELGNLSTFIDNQHIIAFNCLDGKITSYLYDYMTKCSISFQGRLFYSNIDQKLINIF